jgi:hypothetical protein
MFRLLPKISLGLLLALIAAIRAPAEPPPGSAPREGMLLLRTGQILEGKVTPEGDRFFVELTSGKVWI